ncbi:MAG TPA: class I SAM-dependent methyltransferase [Blastocatellia bacterium]|nr:class I SAM-dependent methyltransferase [Blastocatellia bacterium]
MGIIGGTLGYRLLKAICADGETGYMDGSAYNGRSKVEALFGPQIWSELEGKVVIDFGCGAGADAVEIAARGAARVIGLELRENLLRQARLRAEAAGLSDRCAFARETDERADVVLSMDSFEHFDDPAAILKAMRRLLKDDGVAIIEFGPTWYHPLGGHMFSVFPWAHLIFTERCLIRWRSDLKSDGATRFSEIEGGLNQMTIRRFKKLVRESEFEFKSFEPVPIRRLRWLANPLTRELFTAIVRCRLAPRAMY